MSAEQVQEAARKVLQVWRLDLISLADAPGGLSLRSFQMATIRTGGHPACGRLVRALFPVLSRTGGTPWANPSQTNTYRD
jgi:hypothetical protein